MERLTALVSRVGWFAAGAGVMTVVVMGACIYRYLAELRQTP